MPADNTKTSPYKFSAPQKAVRLLEGLKRTPPGTVLHHHIKHILDDSEQAHAETERAYASLLGVLLDAFAKQLPVDAPLRMHVKLVAMRLMPPLSTSEFSALRRYVGIYARQISQSDQKITNILIEALAPLLEGFGVETPADLSSGAQVDHEPPGTQGAKSTSSHISNRIDSAYRQHLDEKRKGMQEIQGALTQQIAQALRQCEDFCMRLEITLGRLRRAENLQALDALRRALIGETQSLLDGNHALGSHLEEILGHIHTIKSDILRLDEELNRVHLLSLTDELTGLSNRRAFLRRLEDEVGRIQRYGSSLAMALIDLDNFKAINDRYGHAAGDEVLRCFASDVLSTFRHHDMVARYGGEEFAILLPNTSSEGVAHALKKVQKHAAETHFKHGDTIQPMPTFSAGIALYASGEDPAALIERADHALYQAKQLGRNRLEFAPEPAQDSRQTSE
ncbi:MAG: GGDEF domain-containing protein [Gammaproteobacteria bacterium]|nr:GGDEF domain-containing protein [Gammaproteobacteria bacterium]